MKLPAKLYLRSSRNIHGKSVENILRKRKRKPNLTDDFIKSFDAEVEKVLRMYIRKSYRTIRNAAYRKIEKLFSRLTAMADEMINVFKKIMEFGSNYCNDGVSSDIIKGILETTEIKILSMCEARSEFFENFSRITDEINRIYNNKKIKDADIRRQVDEICSRVRFDSLTKDNLLLAACIRAKLSEIPSCNLVLAYKTQIEKLISREVDSAASKSLAYLKESLLFEMITFEEIMNYSVSALEPKSGEFAKFMRECSDLLNHILEKNDIYPIAPTARDIFNGREHDAIIAEKNSSYKKGEIIKLINRGYKLDDTVLVRANVIAAK